MCHFFHSNFSFTDCPALVAPANGALSTTDATTGSLVSVSCIAGFSLYGDSTLVCQINGTWTASVGVCRQGNTVPLSLNRYYKAHTLFSAPNNNKAYIMKYSAGG